MKLASAVLTAALSFSAFVSASVAVERSTHSTDDVFPEQPHKMDGQVVLMANGYLSPIEASVIMPPDEDISLSVVGLDAPIKSLQIFRKMENGREVITAIFPFENGPFNHIVIRGSHVEAKNMKLFYGDAFFAKKEQVESLNADNTTTAHLELKYAAAFQFMKWLND